MSTVQVQVDNRISVALEDLDAGELEQLKAVFTHAVPERPGAQQDDEAPSVVETWMQQGERIYLPRGGMSRVRRCLGGRVKVEDRRSVGAGKLGLAHGVLLHPYQVPARDLLVSARCGILRAPTGSGKTTTALAAACALDMWTIVIVWTEGLLDQWRERVARECGISERDVGIVQGERRELAPFTIAMQQTLAANPLTRDECAMFGTLVADEVQRFAAPTLFAAIEPFPAKARIGVSADETRKDRMEFLTYDLFGEVVAEIDQDELVDAGYVHDVQICVVPTGFAAPWYRAAVMSGNRFRAQAAFHKLQKALATSEHRNQTIIHHVRAESPRPSIVMVGRRDHCALLSSLLACVGIPNGVMVGGADGRREFRDTKAGLADGRYRCAVATVQAVGQGLDFPALERSFVACPIAGNRQMWGQVRGRVCRTSEGKDGARQYYFWDRDVYGKKALANVVRWNKSVVVLDRGKWVPGAEYLREM